jgi:hypothetical protein
MQLPGSALDALGTDWFPFTGNFVARRAQSRYCLDDKADIPKPAVGCPHLPGFLSPDIPLKDERRRLLNRRFALRDNG